MRLMVAIMAILFSRTAFAQDAGAKPSDVGATINRGLGFLVKDALAWKAEHNCASCHHAGLVVWAMREARQRGHVVDEPVLAELTKWIASSGDGKTGVPRPPGIPKALNYKPVLFALALESDPELDAVAQAGLKLLLKRSRPAGGTYAFDSRHS